MGYDNASLGGQFGYGYGIGNGYGHSDSHGNSFGHQMIPGPGIAPSAGVAYNGDQASDHMVGYDSVKPLDDDTWNALGNIALAAVNAADANDTGRFKPNMQCQAPDPTADPITSAQSQACAIKALTQTTNTSRKDFIKTVLDKRINRLTEIHNDNLLKIEAPFDLQLDLLDREIEDVLQAQEKATQFAEDYWTDLHSDNAATPGRMEDYLTDREEALNREKDLIVRALERAVDEGKPVDDVLAAMRIDWLQGVYASGTQSFYDADIYDMTTFDNEFDIFTYDLGHGKGHGHTNQANRGQIRSDTGFVIGAGLGENDLDTLKAAPGPVDGKTCRYDRATLSGNDGNGRLNDYEVGLK